MDLVAVWLNSGEGLNRNILQQGKQNKGRALENTLSHSSGMMSLTLQGDICKGKISINNHIFCARVCVPVTVF